MHSELAAVGSKSERISASHTDVAQRMRPISRARDTHMYALGSRDSAAAIVREQQRGAAPRRRAIGKALLQGNSTRSRVVYSARVIYGTVGL